MNQVAIIESAEADGVTLKLSPSGGIRVIGGEVAVGRWLPIIRDHKSELMTLLAANEDGAQEASREASDERAAILEYEGGLPRHQEEAVADLFRAFYGHLMGIGKITNCCYAPVDRYCPEGRRLRDAYYGACS